MIDTLPIDYAVVAVGRTEQEQFPLILIFGRESNGSAEIIPGISLYDETVSSGSAFWNRAYGFIQRITDWKGNFRQSCIEAEMSPIIFTNALPRPIPNALQNKDLLRADVQENEILRHVSGIFGLNIASRVSAVIFSTGTSAVYEFSRTEVKKVCSKKNIPFIEVPYFATQGRPNGVLDQSIECKDAATIRSIVNEFRAYTQQVADPVNNSV